jgi:hypothetical protein
MYTRFRRLPVLEAAIILVLAVIPGSRPGGDSGARHRECIAWNGPEAPFMTHSSLGTDSWLGSRHPAGAEPGRLRLFRRFGAMIYDLCGFVDGSGVGGSGCVE